jgi:enoyl-CoA hydratase/carnithine racemase
LIEAPTVLLDVKGGGGWITLNRPSSLNAINTDSVKKIAEALKDWEADHEVNYVVIEGSGRAFCAGGDLRMLYEAVQGKRSAMASEFFKAEYTLNLLIHNYSKPYIALQDGITMGGGMGLSIHGTYRVVTENTIMSMPETAIGFFPDVGAAWFLNRCPGKSGLYMGLTSARVGPTDALYLGLGTHYVPSARLISMKEELSHSNGEQMTDILKKYHQTPEGDSPIKANQSLIDGYFNQPSIEDVFKALSKSQSPFSVETLSVLKQRSPLSLRTTFTHFKKAENMGIQKVMDEDYKLALKWEASNEFLEGIRAAVVDKDQKPKWGSLPIEHDSQNLL